MALYKKTTIDGIQLGDMSDYCFKCVKRGSAITDDDILEYKEVFKLHFNGLSYTLCLDHLKKMLGNYVLVHKDLLKNDVVTISKDLLENGTEKEILDYLKKAINQ